MNEHRKSRKIRTLLLVPAAAGIAVATAVVVPSGAGAEPAAGQGAPQHRNSTPVGVWEGTVEHAEGAGNVTLSFHRGGVMCLFSGGGADGGGEGTGSWSRTGNDAFTFRVKERLYEADDTTVGYVDVNQKAAQKGETFNSSGVSKIYDADGNFLQSADAKVDVKRVSGTPKAC